MRCFLPSVIFCSALFACASDPPTDDPPDAAVEPQPVAAERDVSPDDATESRASQPEVSADETTTRIEQYEEGDDTHWYTPIWPFPWPWGHHAKPRPIPAPRECSGEHEECYACCDWNVDKVWGERCRRLPRDERRACWGDAERLRGNCQRGCPGPGPIITTVTP